MMSPFQRIAIPLSLSGKPLIDEIDILNCHLVQGQRMAGGIPVGQGVGHTPNHGLDNVRIHIPEQFLINPLLQTPVGTNASGFVSDVD
jgi:hypothetical protein